MAGWLDVLAAADIRPTVVQVNHFGANAGDDAAELLLGLPDRPTAVLCFSDATAYGVVRRARRGSASRFPISCPSSASTTSRWQAA